MRCLYVVCASAVILAAQPPTPLWLRGYSVIPTPRQARLEAGDVHFDATWVLDASRPGVQHIAVRTLAKDLAEWHGIALRPGTAGKMVRLAVAPGAVATKAAPEIDRQAYRLRIADSLIEITANGDPGLLYGVATLVQLLKRDPTGRLLLPKGVIEDWPAYQLRFLHWDTKHHQDRMETLKRYLDWAARFKVNMIGFELEDKFEYPSNPVIGAPGAFTTAQLQEIVNYGLERYIQVVPQIQAPAHLAYVLKHPQFAPLRADGNNYHSALCESRTYELIFSMYDDVMRATRGVGYLFASTDEVYYAGIESQCKRPYNPENRSLAWVEFVHKAREFVHSRGRRMLVWAEYPLLAEHVKLLPPDIIDGVIGEPEYLPDENRLGIRQLAYVSMQGSEFLFPNHLSLEGERGLSRGRLEQAAEYIAHGRHTQGNPIGVYGAAWDDSGLHNETFWLGWSAVAQWGWTPGTPSVEQHVAEFMNVYYGPRVAGMVEIYRSLQRQARAWSRTWDRVVSRVRGPGYGNSYGKGRGTTRYDLTLPAPPLPQGAELTVQVEKKSPHLAEARARALESDQLVHAIHGSFARVDRNHYNLEVLLALTRFIGHHWRLVEGLAGEENSLTAAHEAASKKDPAQAVGRLVAAYNSIQRLEQEGERIFRELEAVYEKSRFPKGRTVDGRKFVHLLDDTKDHWADRTPDLSFMMAPERSIGLAAWRKQLADVIQAYAKTHNVPVRGLGEARLEE